MKNTRSFKFARAFTLVELIVVIAIISLMAGIIIANLSTSKAKSRDAQRVSDLAQIQVALGLYFDRCNQFPNSIPTNSTTLASVSNNCPVTTPQISLASYISKIPTPPSGKNQSSYDYSVNSGMTDYVLHASLEGPNDSVTTNGLPTSAGSASNGYTIENGTPTGGPFTAFTCSNAAGSTDYCIGPK